MRLFALALGGDNGRVDTGIGLDRRRLSSLYDPSAKVSSLWFLLVNQNQLRQVSETSRGEESLASDIVAQRRTSAAFEFFGAT